MDAYVIEHIAVDQEERELHQAGDDPIACLSELSMLMLVGHRIVFIYKNGQPLTPDEFGDMMIKAARLLAVSRLATSFGIDVVQSQKLFGEFLGMPRFDE